MTAQLRAVIDRTWAWFNLPGNFTAKKKTVLSSTSGGGEDYPFMLEQYGMYKMFGWEDLGHVLGAGKEEEAKTLGASIR